MFLTLAPPPQALAIMHPATLRIPLQNIQLSTLKIVCMTIEMLAVLNPGVLKQLRPEGR